jgi:hypothetical protein
MNDDLIDTEQYDKPVAYDANGRPLYAHPAVTVQPEPVSKPAVDIINSEVSLETKLKHDSSKRYYPNLNLQDDEYVITTIRRHPIGLLLPLAAGIILIAFAISILYNYDLFVRSFNLTGDAAQASTIALPVLLITILIGIGTYITYFVYTSNKFYLTSENIIQDVQVSLFSHVEKIVSLDNIEDARFQQKGIFQQFFDYGSIRLSTEGNATAYNFTYASHPKECIDMLNNAIETCKNSRGKKQIKQLA